MGFFALTMLMFICSLNRHFLKGFEVSGGFFQEKNYCEYMIK